MEKSDPPDVSPNSPLELLFAKNALAKVRAKAHANRSKNFSSLAHRALNNKNEIVAHPTGHVTLILTQQNNQPTIPRH
jgi:hypothetical protein